MDGQGLTSEEIYSALLDDDCFARLPTRLAESFRGRSTLVHWHHSDGSAEVLAHSKYFSDDQLLTYTRDFAQLDPWAQAAAQRQPANCATDLESLVPPSLYERSVFYNEFIRGIGDDTYRCLGIRIQNDFGSGMIAIQRGKNQRSYDPEIVSNLSDMAVHLRRMLSVRGKFTALKHQAQSLQAMLNSTPHAAMLVDGAGTLLVANAAGEQLLRSGDTLSMRDGRIQCGQDRSAQLLRKALYLACSLSPSSSAVPLKGGAERPLLATIMPVSSPGHPRNALVLVQDTHQRDASLNRQLQSLFGLTAAEAAIAERLSDGLSLKEIADTRRVSLATVRGQVKCVAQKMDSHRQGEIISIVKTIIPARAN